MNRPVSPVVYRRRRLAVAVAAVLVVVVIWLLIRLVTGGDSASTGQPKPDSSASASGSQVTSNGATQVALASSGDACDPQQVRITPTVPADQQAGGDVRINLAVSTSAGKPCTLSPDEAALVVDIKSKAGPVYDSTVCSTSLLTAPVSLSPQWVTVTPVVWSGRAGCRGSEAFVLAGEYTVRLGTLGGEPGRATFMLTPAPEPTPEPTPEPATEPAPAPEAAQPSDPAAPASPEPAPAG